MFHLQKLLSPFLYPVPLCLLLLVAGLLLLWFTRRKTLGRVLVTVGTGLLLVAGSGWVSDGLVGRLESVHPPLLVRGAGGPLPPALRGVKWIVVLGGGTRPDPRSPLSARLTGASMARLVEGLRLQGILPHSRLLLSGGSVFGTAAEARLMERLARAIGRKGVPIVVEDRSRDTKDQARTIGRIVGRQRFFLVTSASHMKRAVALFRGQGLSPIPAPTDQLSSSAWRRRAAPASIFPSVHGLLKVRRAVHEYAGLLWARLRGQI